MLRNYVIAVVGLLVVSCELAAQRITPVPNAQVPAPTRPVSLLPPAYNSSATVNYLRTRTPRVPVTDEDSIDNLPASQVRQTTVYIDGQGRPVQTVGKQLSPTGKDIISIKVYDQYGRETVQYLPYTSTGSDGSFRSNPFLEQQQFMAARHPGEHVYYGYTALEASPLQRPDTNFAPGNSWAGSGRGMVEQRELNTAADEVRRWMIGEGNTDIPTVAEIYADSELWKYTATDEQGKQTVEYKDRENRTVLKKVQIADHPSPGHAGWLCTYYVYDGYSLLRAVIQPKAVERLTTNNYQLTTDLLDELCFRYAYDQRNRTIMKKVPGAGWVYMVYDARDRLVMMQDGNLRNQNKWQVTVFDAINRPVQTGLFTSALTREQHQQNAYGSTGYPNTSTGFELLTETYYDDYDWVNGTGLSATLNTQDINGTNFLAAYNAEPFFAQPIVQQEYVRGQVTGNKTRILGTNTFIYTIPIYDRKYRIIQTQSTNATGGTDISTNQYSWEGKLIRSFIRHNKAGANPQTYTLATKAEFDHAGRVLKIWKNINGTGDQLISQNEYDEQGQLKAKKLGTKGNAIAASGTPIETLNYDQNIRGWLTGINKDYAEGFANLSPGVAGTSWFGMKLNYDYGFTKQQFNGNISGWNWRSRGDGEQRAYGFEYDGANRLLKADFSQLTNSAWNLDAGIDFSVYGAPEHGGRIGYDGNGNILSMFQKGVKGLGSVTIDEMKYSYGPGNKLLKVTDPIPTQQPGDFTDGQNAGDDYSYDNNGNLIRDENKGITNIVYNHLNLTQIINLGPKGVIEYLYDATGNKTAKIVADKTIIPTKITRTDYLGEFIYRNDTLEFISHEEGRIRPKNPNNSQLSTNNQQLPANNSQLPTNNFVYDYFIKDHLGNVRMVLTGESNTAKYFASFEPARDEVEGATFSNRNDDKVTLSASNPLSDMESKYGIRLNGSEPARRIGPSLLLKVMSGDTLNMGVKAFYPHAQYPSADPVPMADMLLQLVNTFVGSNPVALDNEGNLLQGSNGNTLFTPPFSSFLDNQNNANNQDVKASLNYLLFDEQFKPGQSGYLPVDGSNHDLQVLAQSLTVNKNGYLYLWVSNSSSVDVFFDGLAATHRTGPLLQEDHYYPFGLTMAGISSKAAGRQENRRKFVTQELDSELDLGWYQFKYRNHDPQIGRFTEIDPLAHEYVYNSTYAYAENRVINGIDLEGKEFSLSQTLWGMAADLGAVRPDMAVARFAAYVNQVKSDAFGAVDATAKIAQGDYSATTTPGPAAVQRTQAGTEKIKARIDQAKPAFDVLDWTETLASSLPFAEAGGIEMGFNVGKFSLREAPKVLQIGSRLPGELVSEALPEVAAMAEKVHGNSLKSLKPTWGYKLFSDDGTFLKNGITSKIVPEKRYTRNFMTDKKMKSFPFPNRKAAWEWEFQQNKILKGPLNKNMH